MSILDNLEAYLEARYNIDPEAENKERCHYCKAMAIYDDLAQVNKTYQVVGVCACHSYKGLSS
jgi:hypothetical protein